MYLFIVKISISDSPKSIFYVYSSLTFLPSLEVCPSLWNPKQFSDTFSSYYMIQESAQKGESNQKKTFIYMLKIFIPLHPMNKSTLIYIHPPSSRSMK